MDISSALKILRDATAEALQSHHQEVLSTLTDVEQRLNSVSSSNHQTECASASSAYSASISNGSDRSSADEVSSYDDVSESETSVESHHHRPASGKTPSENLEKSTSPDWPAKLLAACIDGLRWLHDFSGNEPAEVIKHKRSQGRDKRIEDIQRVEGRRRPGNVDKVFRGLAQRSMALQFTQIQLDAKINPRVDELCESILSLDPEVRACIHRRSGFITRNLHHFNFAPEDREIVLRGINAGVKQQVVEKLLGKRLEESGRVNQPAGISALTSLSITAFNRIRFEDIPRFIDLIFLPSSQVELPLDSFATGPDSPGTAFFTKSFHVPDIIERLSGWYERFQRCYDKDVISTESPDLQPPLSKRHCSGLNRDAATLEYLVPSTNRAPNIARIELQSSSNSNSNSQAHCVDDNVNPATSTPSPVQDNSTSTNDSSTSSPPSSGTSFLTESPSTCSRRLPSTHNASHRFPSFPEPCRWSQRPGEYPWSGATPNNAHPQSKPNDGISDIQTTDYLASQQMMDPRRTEPHTSRESDSANFHASGQPPNLPFPDLDLWTNFSQLPDTDLRENRSSSTDYDLDLWTRFVNNDTSLIVPGSQNTDDDLDMWTIFPQPNDEQPQDTQSDNRASDNDIDMWTMFPRV